MARSPTTSDAFNAIAERRRRQIIGILAEREHTVADLVAVIGDVTQPQVSKHLRVLRKVGLVDVRRDGRMRRYRLNAAPLEEIHHWVTTFEPFWDHQLAEIKKRAEGKRQSSSAKAARARRGTSKTARTKNAREDTARHQTPETPGD